MSDANVPVEPSSLPVHSVMTLSPATLCMSQGLGASPGGL